MLVDNSLSNEAAKLAQAEVIKVNVSQILEYSSVKKKYHQSTEKIRHLKTNEPPFPVKMRLFIYSVTKKTRRLMKTQNTKV